MNEVQSTNEPGEGGGLGELGGGGPGLGPGFGCGFVGLGFGLGFGVGFGLGPGPGWTFTWQQVLWSAPALFTMVGLRSWLLGHVKILQVASQQETTSEPVVDPGFGK